MSFDRLRRREFIALISGAAAWPMTARAQQAAMPVVGYLSAGSRSSSPEPRAAFRQGLKDMGYAEGQNVTIEYQWAEGRYDLLAGMAAEMVARRVAVIAASPSPAALAAKAATSIIPIVFSVGADPVQSHLVANLNRPGSNLTGSTFFTGPLIAKRFELLLELVPKPAFIALLNNPANPGNGTSDVQEAVAAASALGQKINVLNASTAAEIDTAFATLPQQEPRALVIGGDRFLNSRRDQLALLAARYAIPAVYPLRIYVTSGGLMSYGTDSNESARQQGVYVGRILKGEKPAELPVVQPTRFELVINLRAAKAIGLTIPELFLARADEVIE
jgi:putative tryptophan/tyrosine transport system substrate-binding protein